MVVTFSMLTAVGLSNLSAVNMAIPRNQCIIGLSLILGLMLPAYMKYPDVHINTGSYYGQTISNAAELHEKPQICALSSKGPVYAVFPCCAGAIS